MFHRRKPYTSRMAWEWVNGIIFIFRSSISLSLRFNRFFNNLSIKHLSKLDSHFKIVGEKRSSTYGIRGNAVLDEARELFLVGVLILLHQVSHVFRDVQAQDVLAVNLCIELLALGVITRETLGAKTKIKNSYAGYTRFQLHSALMKRAHAHFGASNVNKSQNQSRLENYINWATTSCSVSNGVIIKKTEYEMGKPKTNCSHPIFWAYSEINSKKEDLPVRNGETSIHRSLQGTEHLVASGGSGQACIQVAGESSWLPINALHIKLIPSDLHLSLVHLVKAKFVQQLEEST